jgi:hypothetical protein
VFQREGEVPAEPEPRQRAIIRACSKSSHALKSQYPSAKSQTTANHQIAKPQTEDDETDQFGTLFRLDFEFVWDFVVGVWDFPFEDLFEWGPTTARQADSAPQMQIS